MAARANFGAASRLSSVTCTVLADLHDWDLDHLLGAEDCFFEGNCHVIAQISAALGTVMRSPTTARPKKCLKNIGEPAKIGESVKAPGGAGVAESVICGSLA